MFFRKNIKTTAVAAALLVLASGTLVSCGKADKTAAQSTAAQSASQSIGDQYPEQYKNYIDSFTSEVDSFVKDELPEILQEVAGLNASNYAEWKAKYTAALEKTEHWYNEVGSAEMFCPSGYTEKHQALVTTVATFYKILEGLQTRTEAADNGDFSQLTSKGAEYAQAAQIANEMWTRAVSDIQSDLNQ